jgi:hypothetical protein
MSSCTSLMPTCELPQGPAFSLVSLCPIFVPGRVLAHARILYKVRDEWCVPSKA